MELLSRRVGRNVEMGVSILPPILKRRKHYEGGHVDQTS
jgi:hypothetical protein